MSVAQPLAGLKVLEFEGIGPGPMAGLILQGMGACVTVVRRPSKAASMASVEGEPQLRGKSLVTIDLKSEVGVAAALALIEHADVLIEGNRPGVMERLGLSPQACLKVNPSLIYARMTGWGQSGPLAQTAGHDLNYVALTGLLSLTTQRGAAPIIPPTVVGDASGALGLCFGIACAVADIRAGGKGRVVDGAIVDIVSMLGMIAQWMRPSGQVDGAEHGSVFHDSPYYDTYQCMDGKFVSIAAMEPKFYDLLLRKLGLDDVDRQQQDDQATWPDLKRRLAAIFLSRERHEWCELLEGTDVCFAPVLSMDEAVTHPHNVARASFTEMPGGEICPAIAPKFI